MRLKRQQSAVVAMLLLALWGWMPFNAMAQMTELPAEADQTKMDPTPIEELVPGGEGEQLPGTEPLYDKGVLVTQVQITGNQYVDDQVILEAIKTRPGTIYSKSQLKDDLKRIYDTGYFTDKLRVVPVATRDGIHIKFEVEENPKVQSIDFDGNEVVDSKDLAPIFQKQLGMPENVNMLNKGIQKVEEYYRDKGYVLARVDDIREDEPGKIKLVINEGKIANITYKGNKKTKDYVITRAMAQQPGEVYNEKTVSADLKRVFSLQSFSDVRRVVSASPEKPGEYNLTVEVDEKKTGSISLGGGIDTSLGLFGSLGYADPNFRGRGESVNTILSMGTGYIGKDIATLKRRVTQFQAGWSTPSIGDTNNSLSVNLSGMQYGSFNVPLSLEKRFSTGVTWAKPVTSHPGVSIGTTMGAEHVALSEGVNQSVLNVFGVTPQQRAKMLQNGSYLNLSPFVAIDSRNNQFNPTEGSYKSIGTRFNYGLGNSSYTTLNGSVSKYVPINSSLTLALNTQSGGTLMGNVPAFNMFRMGGAYSVRGFQEGGIGIGKSYMLGSAELRGRLPFLRRFKQFPLYDIVQGALFADAGTLIGQSDTNAMFRKPGYGYSIGAGLRLNLPAVGPLRIDYGVPLGSNKGAHIRNINFGVGQKF